MRYHYIVPKLPSVEVSLEKQTICWYILKMHALGIWDLSSHRERCIFFFAGLANCYGHLHRLHTSMGLLYPALRWELISNTLVCTCGHEHNFDCFISLAGLSPWEQTVVVVTHGNSWSLAQLCLSSAVVAPCRVAHLLKNTCYARISLRTWFHASGT